jgi:hypothetical protein
MFASEFFSIRFVYSMCGGCFYGIYPFYTCIRFLTSAVCDKKKGIVKLFFIKFFLIAEKESCLILAHP